MKCVGLPFRWRRAAFRVLLALPLVGCAVGLCEELNVQERHGLDSLMRTRLPSFHVTAQPLSVAVELLADAWRRQVGELPLPILLVEPRVGTADDTESTVTLHVDNRSVAEILTLLAGARGGYNVKIRSNAAILEYPVPSTYMALVEIGPRAFAALRLTGASTAEDFAAAVWRFGIEMQGDHIATWLPKRRTVLIAQHTVSVLELRGLLGLLERGFSITPPVDQ